MLFNVYHSRVIMDPDEGMQAPDPLRGQQNDLETG